MSASERYQDLAKWWKSLASDKMMPKAFDETFSLWNRYKEHGTLPEGGGWYDQPSYIIDDFMFYEVVQELFQTKELLSYIEREIRDLQNG